MKRYVKCNKNDIANITRLVEDLHEWYMTNSMQKLLDDVDDYVNLIVNTIDNNIVD